MRTSGSATSGCASRVSRLGALLLTLVLHPGSMRVTASVSEAPSPSIPVLSTEWVTTLGPATPSGFFRFAACDDGSVIAYSAPATWYRIDPTGQITIAAEFWPLAGTRSVDCSSGAVHVLRYDGAFEAVVLDATTLTESRRVRLPSTDMPLAGLKVLGSGAWILSGGMTGGVAAPLADDGRIGAALGMFLPRPGRGNGNKSIVTPLFQRSGDSGVIHVQTQDYTVAEFDQSGELRRVWRRDDDDFSRSRVPLLPGRVVEDESIIGCAMRPDGSLVVQVNKRREHTGQSYVERVSPDYRVAEQWALPRKGMLFGAGPNGALYFAYASFDGLLVFKANAPLL